MKPIAVENYEKLADRYAEIVPTKAHNAFYDRPACLSLIDEVQGRNILDAGCGPGIYSEILLDRKASVTGIDISQRMLAHAKERTRGRVRLLLANLEQPLIDLQEEEFDGVLCPLAISYVRDVSPLFKEFYRVLKAGGWLVFSTEHPFFSYRYFDLDNYFETRAVSCDWSGFGEKITMNSYYHSLGCLCDGLTGNGFKIERILEAKPEPEFEKQNPEGYRKLLEFPLFIHFKARKM